MCRLLYEEYRIFARRCPMREPRDANKQDPGMKSLSRPKRQHVTLITQTGAKSFMTPPM